MKIILSACVAVALQGAVSGVVPASSGRYSLEVRMDRNPAVYAAGETAKLHVRVLADGKPVGDCAALCSWNYVCSNRVEIAETGTTFELTLDRPGQIMFRGDIRIGTNVVFGTKQDGRKVPLIIWAGAVFAPERIAPVRHRPTDFDVYWDEAVAEMKRLVPLEQALVRMTPVAAVEGFEAFSVEVPCLPRPACAYLTKPKGASAKSLSAVVMFQGYGAWRSVSIARRIIPRVKRGCVISL